MVEYLANGDAVESFVWVHELGKDELIERSGADLGDEGGGMD